MIFHDGGPTMKTLLALSLVAIVAQAAPVASGKLILKAPASDSRTIFLVVQDPSSPMPMPCAAQKIELTKPLAGELAFTLDSDKMQLMACPAVPEVFHLKAKLDKDGSAGKDSTGDIVGIAQNIKKGAKNVNVTLDKVVP